MLKIFTLMIMIVSSPLQVSKRNESGDYKGARTFSTLVLFCDILVFIYYVLAVFGVLVFLFTVGVL